VWAWYRYAKLNGLQCRGDPMKIFLFLILALPLLAQDAPKPTDKTEQEVYDRVKAELGAQLAAKDAEIAMLKAKDDAKLSVLSQAVSNCFQAMDRLTGTPVPSAPAQPQRQMRPGRGPEQPK
jgi:hypothetical protein